MKNKKDHILTGHHRNRIAILHILLAVLVLVVTATSVQAQQVTDPSKKKRPFWVYAGVGPNYYFNNLVTAKKLVNELNYSVVTRFMWQPEHLLSLGFETGYFRLYTIRTGEPSNVHIVNSVIPLHIVVSMKFLQDYYVNLTMGQSILLNKVNSTTYGNFDATSFSLADFGATIGYRYWLEKRISICAETKFFYSTSSNDKNIALVFLVAYNL